MPNQKNRVKRGRRTAYYALAHLSENSAVLQRDDETLAQNRGPNLIDKLIDGQSG